MTRNGGGKGSRAAGPFQVIPSDPRAVRALARALHEERLAAPDRLRDRFALLSFQQRRLEELLQVAVTHSRHYREIAAALEVDSTADLALYSRLPVLRRDEYRAWFDELVSRAPRPFLGYEDRTSGTTGVPVRVLRDSRAVLFESLRLHVILSYYLGRPPDFAPGRCAVLYVSHFDGSGEHVYRDPLLDGAEIVKVRCDQGNVAQRLRDRRIRLGDRFVLSGTPSSLACLAADPAARTGLPAPALVLASGETLLPAVRSLVREIFGAPVFETYSLREVGLVGFQCRNTPALHLCTDWFVVETVRDERPIPAGRRDGELVITDLRNHLVPLLRYATGDQGSITWRTGCCELALPSLATFSGREAVSFRQPSGEPFDPAAVAKQIERLDVLWYRISQRRDRSVEIEYSTRDENVAREVAAVRERMLEMLGEGGAVRIERISANLTGCRGKCGGLHAADERA